MARKPVHLVLVEEKSVDGVDHNKFYDMFEIDGKLHCYYGRRKDGYEFGKSGSLKVYDLWDWEDKYYSKLRKGYEDKSHLYDEIIIIQDNKKSEYKKIHDIEIARLVDRLQKYAQEVISANYSVVSGQVTRVMIEETQKHLDHMASADDIKEFNTHLKEVFKIIPRSMSRVDAFLAKTESDRDDIITREQDLLDIMRGQVVDPVIKDEVESDTNEKTILEAHGIEMSRVNEKDIELIKRKLGSNAHKLKSAWKVTNTHQKAKYDEYLKAEGIRKRNTKLLWHGTRNENVFNILKTGLVLRPTNAVKTGSMFGMGIYFAPLAQKSIGYTSLSGSYWARGKSNTGFLVLHEVAYGNPYEVYDFHSSLNGFNYKKLKEKSQEYNCLHAKAGKGMLRNDEIVVYREDQLSALYLVEIE